MRKSILPFFILFGLNAWAGDTIQYSVYFNTNAYRPIKSSAVILDSVMQFLAGKKIESVTVSGYADSTGSRELNLKLSEKRAKTVADTLLKKGLDEKLVTRAFYGKDNPKYPNATREGRAKNRRVDIDIKLKKDCPKIYYGPNKEEVEIDTNTFKGFDCETIKAEFTVVVNQEQLDNSKTFTAQAENGDGLWSGGMLKCVFTRDSMGTPIPIPCFGNVTARLPKSVYSNNGMEIYTGKEVNGKTVWSLDPTTTVTDKNDFYEMSVSCDDLARGKNFDKKKNCICTACQTAFVSGAFPTTGEANTVSTNRGITLKMEEGKTNFAISDVWNECFLESNHIYNAISNNSYTYYRHLVSVNTKSGSADSLTAHAPTGNARLYLCKEPTTPDAETHLYEWVMPDKTKAGFWQLTASPLQKILSDKGCAMYWFPVTETGLYMISDATASSTRLEMKMGKKFVLLDGYTVSRKNSQNSPAVVLPVTKEGKKVTATLSAENTASVTCAFKKKNKYYLFDYTTARIHDMANGKILKIKKKLLVVLPNDKVEDALNKICMRSTEQDNRSCP